MLNFKLDRTIRFNRFPVRFYIYVQNVLNHKNVKHVYVHTGDTDDDGDLTPNVAQTFRRSQGEEFLQLYDYINLGHRQHYRIARGSDLFGHPREIRFGLELQFDVVAQL